jgi:hypothetical protein
LIKFGGMKKIRGKKFNAVLILACVIFFVSTYLWHNKKWQDQRIILENSSSYEIIVSTARNNRNSLVLNDSIVFYKCGTEDVLLKSSTKFINVVSKQEIEGDLISPPYVLKKDKGSDSLIITTIGNNSFFYKTCE